MFCISWRNVDAHDRELDLDDYRQLGVMAALGAISSSVPEQRIHATGYCFGGTLLCIATAAMAGVGVDRLASVSLFAAQIDFSEPGELQVFIDDSEIYLLESMMWSQGYLAASQMAGAFQLLQSNDLIWSRIVRDYLLGERRVSLIYLTAWNADTTRMPYRMHSEYLRHLFLDNDLACSRYQVGERHVSIRNIRVPMFAVGTEHDHIAPWHSVFKIHDLSDRYRHHIRAHERRPQRRHHQRTEPSASAFQAQANGSGRSAHRFPSVARHGDTAGGFMVARVERMKNPRSRRRRSA